MFKCDYCDKEIDDLDVVFDGYDYSCSDCCEDFCEHCGNLLTPTTSETYEGMCRACWQEEQYNEHDEF